MTSGIVRLLLYYLFLTNVIVQTQNPLGLRAASNLRGILFGTAVDVENLRDHFDGDEYNNQIKNNYDLVVPENELKPQQIWQGENVYDWTNPDFLLGAPNATGWVQQNLMKIRGHNLVWAYESYLSNGFDDKIISNNQNKTWLASSKNNSDRFEENFNGVPLVTVKTALKHKKIGEIGISWMGGVYNKFRIDGLVIDKKRRIDLFALDFNTTLPILKTYINTEWVWALIDVPGTYTQQFGSKQKGGFIDFVQPFLKRDVLGWKNSTFNVALRFEYTDYNVGNFIETNENIHDDIIAFTPGLSFRPSLQTVFRLNYRYLLETDILGNDPSKTAGIQFGFSTYF